MSNPTKVSGLIAKAEREEFERRADEYLRRDKEERATVYTIHKCPDCGRIEGEFPQAGCCPGCGVATKPKPIKVAEVCR